MEIPLTGGNTTPGVVRWDETVRRPRGRRSVFATRALQELARLGFRFAPTHLGVDAEGRDVLEFVEGATTDHPSQRREESYAAFGAILADLHRRTSGTSIADGGACLVHGDPGPFNVIMRDGMPVALIDWDSVHPGDPMEDVGYAAWTWCVHAAGAVPIADQARRLREFAHGYATDLSAEDLFEAIDRSQSALRDVEERVSADESALPARRDHARIAIDWVERSRELLRTHEATFRRACEEPGGLDGHS